jgi:pyruvate/2-oxoacid:ferredoxin oxidoreductase alpha subunit
MSAGQRMAPVLSGEVGESGGADAGSMLLLTGNHAVSYGAMLARPDVVPIYPITPQTPIVEKISDLQLEGRFDVDILTAESEHSAMAAAIAASLTGVRVFTATSSQGLLLMHEVLHYASGARAPLVMAEVNRTVASPWGFWPDQTDSLSQRDTGWIQYYSESPQESLDTVIQAFRLAETVFLPVMVVHEAFYVSHALEPVAVPAQARVDEYLPPFAPPHYLDPDLGESWGSVLKQEDYYRHRKNLAETMSAVPELALEADQDYAVLIGRGYGVVESYRCEGAGTLIVASGSLCGTARAAVDEMQADGQTVGLLKIRLFNPFPVDFVRTAVSGVTRLVVLDRNVSPGIGGVLAQSVKSALYGLQDAPAVHSYLAGVGGVNVSPGEMRELVRRATRAEPRAESEWSR